MSTGRSPSLLSLLVLTILTVPAAAQDVDGTIRPKLVFEGTISTVGDVDVLEFEAVAGTFLTVVVKADKQQPLLPRVVVEAPAGAATLASVASGKSKTLAKKVPLETTGTYRILVSGDDDTTGSYRLAVKEKLPGPVRRVDVEAEIDAAGVLVLPLDCLAGDVLSARIVASGKDNEALPGTPVLEGPEGTLSLVDSLKTNAKGTQLKLIKVPADAFGTQELRVANVGGSGSLKGRLQFKRPKQPKGVLVEDEDGGDGGGGDDEQLPGTGPTVATDFGASIAFLYTGPDAPQIGVDPDAMVERSLAVVGGVVRDRDGLPLEGATVAVVGAPEFGHTLTDADGRWFLALTGGGQRTVQASLDGYLPVQRGTRLPWRDLVTLPDILLTPLDTAVTTLTAGGGTQLAQGSPVIDDAGTRQATLVFPAGTSAQMVLPGGGRQALASLDVRATEYTVGTGGPAAMPADLPPSSAYTYCVELSVDEALDAGASRVEFSQPLPYYVDNFLDFPVGGAVPLGAYDRESCEWEAAPSGRVLALVAEVGGLAQLDLDGDGDADGDDDGEAAALGIDAAELELLADLYEPGQELWRVALPHFTPWDCNWPYVPPSDAAPPDINPPRTVNPEGTLQQQDPCDETGSVIEVANQVLGEAIPLTGLGMDLVYRSDRVPGRLVDRQIEIPVSGLDVPGSTQEIEVRVAAKGVVDVQTFPPVPGQSTTYTWNGLDALGQAIVGPVRATVTVSNRFEGVYAQPADFATAFGLFSNVPLVGNVMLNTIDFPVSFTRDLGSWDARAQGLGGWALSEHHVYLPERRQLLLGDGRRRDDVSGAPAVINEFAGYGDLAGLAADGIPAEQADLAVHDLVVAPDGSVYVSTDGFIHRIDPDGIVHRVAGQGPGLNGGGDDGPALDASICGRSRLALGPDGSLYVSETFCDVIRRIRPDGIIERVAGTGSPAPFGVAPSGVVALETPLGAPAGVAVGPDGTVYFAEEENGVIRRIGTDGVLTTIAGKPGGPPNLTVDVPAVGLGIANPELVAVAPDGSVLFDINNVALRRVDNQGIVRRVLGNSFSCTNSGEGVDGATASAGGATSAVYAPDGTLYIACLSLGVVRALGTDGILRTVAGIPLPGCGFPDTSNGNGGPALKARVARPIAVGLRPDGAVVIGERSLGLRLVDSPFAVFSLDDILVADEGGELLYRFDRYGRHLQTFDALTHVALWTFQYDEAGRLLGARDEAGLELTITRDVDGEPTGLAGPFGHAWQLDLDAEGWLASAVGPSGETWTLSTSADGLLTSLTDPDGGLHTYGYDAVGRLELDEGPAGASLALSRVVTPAATAADPTEVEITATSSQGRQTVLSFSYAADDSVTVSRQSPSGALTRRTSLPSGDRNVDLPDGSSLLVEEGADDRFGLQAPVTTLVIAEQPGGDSRQLEGQRSSLLADPQDLFSQLSRDEVVERDNLTWTRTWDATTGTLDVVTGKGRQVSAELDALGRMVSLTPGPGLAPWEATYDDQGLVTRLDLGGLSEVYDYDAQGRVSTITDALGRVQQLGHDASDRLVAVTSPAGRAWSLAYDGGGRVTQVLMPSGDAHAYAYDGAGRLASYTPPGSAPYLRSYSDDGEWSGSQLPGGRSVVVVHDAITGLLTSESVPEATTGWSWVTGGGCCASEQLESVTRSPVALGQAQSITYTYDGGLDLLEVWAGAADFTVEYGWDGTRHLDQLTVDGASRFFARDNDGLLTADAGFTLERDVSTGLLDALDDGTGRVEHGFDALGRLASRSLRVGGVELYSWAATFDAGAQLVAVDETLDGADTARSYTRDLDGQLLEESVDDVQLASWAYDDNGNRTEGPEGVASYDAQDRITALDGTPWTVDVDGFLAARGGDAFVHDARGRMLQAQVDGTTVTYSYDGLGRRTARHVGGDTWEYLYADPFSPWAVSACRTPDGLLTLYYYDEAGALFAFDRDGSRYYVGCDAQGSPRVVVDAVGALVKVVEHDAWGRVLADSDPAFDLPVGFAGGLLDEDTGFVRFGQRDYDPLSGRFLTRDPLLVASAQTNLYAYCANNPLDRDDPSGLAFCVKGKAYRGVGADAQVCLSSEGLSFCAAVGLGVGAGFEFEPFGELARSGTYNEISIKGKLGPISIGPKWKFTECEWGKLKFDCDIGPFNVCQGKGKKKDITEKPPLKGPKLQEYLKKMLKLKFGLEGVVTGGGCARLTW